MPSSATLCCDALSVQEVCDLLWGFPGSAMTVDECDRLLLHFVQYQFVVNSFFPDRRRTEGILTAIGNSKNRLEKCCS